MSEDQKVNQHDEIVACLYASMTPQEMLVGDYRANEVFTDAVYALGYRRISPDESVCKRDLLERAASIVGYLAERLEEETGCTEQAARLFEVELRTAARAGK